MLTTALFARRRSPPPRFGRNAPGAAVFFGGLEMRFAGALSILVLASPVFADEWSEATFEEKLGDVRVSVTEVKIAKVALKSLRDASESKEELLQVFISIANAGSKKKLDY